MNSFKSSNENWLEISNKSEPLVCPEVILDKNPKNTEQLLSYEFLCKFKHKAKIGSVPNLKLT